MPPALASRNVMSHQPIARGLFQPSKLSIPGSLIQHFFRSLKNFPAFSDLGQGVDVFVQRPVFFQCSHVLSDNVMHGLTGG